MSGKASGNRFGWLSAEEEDGDLGVEEVRREKEQAPSGTPVTGLPYEASENVPGLTQRRRRRRSKDPKALRNDPQRMMAGARIRRDIRRRVDQALADPAVTGEEGTNYSLLVESLLVRWLREVGYPLEDR